jgi:hypothetical protein
MNRLDRVYVSGRSVSLRFGLRCHPDSGAAVAPTRGLSSIATIATHSIGDSKNSSLPFSPRFRTAATAGPKVLSTSTFAWPIIRIPVLAEAVHAGSEPGFGTAEKNLPRLHRETTAPDPDPFRRIDPRRNSRVGNYAGPSPAAFAPDSRELARRILRRQPRRENWSTLRT